MEVVQDWSWDWLRGGVVGWFSWCAWCVCLFINVYCWVCDSCAEAQRQRRRLADLVDNWLVNAVESYLLIIWGCHFSEQVRPRAAFNHSYFRCVFYYEKVKKEKKKARAKLFEGLRLLKLWLPSLFTSLRSAKLGYVYACGTLHSGSGKETFWGQQEEDGREAEGLWFWGKDEGTQRRGETLLTLLLFLGLLSDLQFCSWISVY